MIKRIIFIVTFLAPLFVYSKDGSAEIALKNLDQCIEQRSDFESAKEKRIQSLEIRSSNINLELSHKYNLYVDLYNEYQSYKYDSAYSLAGKMLNIAEKLKDPNRIADSKIALAFSCMSAGLYKEASEISYSIDTLQLQINSRIKLYSFMSTLYMDMANFSGTKPFDSRYRSTSLEYCKKCIALSKKMTPELIMVKIRTYQLENNYKKATKTAEQYLSYKNMGPHDYAIIASTLGYFYQIKGDTANAIICFSHAAMIDIKMATKETSAIRQLADLLYKQGDVQRAFSYATLALDDANFYNARQRKIEVGRVLPIIEAGRFDIIKHQNNKLLIYSGLISILFILLLMSTFIILKQKKGLNSARLLILQQNSDLLESNEQLTKVQKEISKQNVDLVHINEKLKEVQRIKEEYIGYFFSTNSVYLEKIEDYRKIVARKIRNRQFDELIQLNASFDLRKEREDLFALFDQIFMKLFPDFIIRYNQLFKEEDQVKIKSDGILSPEIRIFALIRLGITESERIAKFLDFSLSTVKNYKTKAKNRSIIPNELFEQKIMEIESVKTDIQE